MQGSLVQIPVPIITPESSTSPIKFKIGENNGINYYVLPESAAETEIGSNQLELNIKNSSNELQNQDFLDRGWQPEDLSAGEALLALKNMPRNSQLMCKQTLNNDQACVKMEIFILKPLQNFEKNFFTFLSINIFCIIELDFV